MSWTLWIVAGVAFVCVFTCAVRWGTEYRDGAGKEVLTKQESQMQAAVDILNNYPTAAGKEKK